jgi:hypothetical protein
MADSRETLCPIDEHGCQNPDCLLHPYFPSCLQAGHALIPALSFLDSLKIPLDAAKQQKIREITDLLGIDYSVFIQYLNFKIQNQKPK